MSRYLSIWNALKQSIHSQETMSLGVKITSPVSLHARVIKGVIRTKDEDTLFKFECMEKCKKYKLRYRKQGVMVHFWLIEYINVKGL